MADIPPEILRNAKLNALNSVAVVAVLIATVTFDAGINPPSIAGDKASFEIFSIFNDSALFVSLFLVLVITSFNLVKETALEVLLGISTVIMWVAVICMAVAYVAARWVLLPHGHWTWWWTVAIGGSIIFIAAGVLILVHVRLMPKFPHFWRLRRMEFSI